jgi:NADH-quinone oxidoreductase B subunit
MSGKPEGSKEEMAGGAFPDEPPQSSAIFLHSDDFLDWITGVLERVIEKSQMRDRLAKPLTRKMMSWGMKWAMWPIHFGIMCCALEMASSGASRYDTTRIGMIYRSSPRQCDILMVTGPISRKVKPTVLRLWEQMPEPKWVIAMGECAISGGPYYDSYNVIPGVDQFLPVDIYIPGCPARPEALIDGFFKLQELIDENKNKDVWRRHPEERKKVIAERRKRIEAKLAAKAERYKKKVEEKGKEEPAKVEGAEDKEKD